MEQPSLVAMADPALTDQAKDIKSFWELCEGSGCSSKEFDKVLQASRGIGSVAGIKKQLKEEIFEAPEGV